MRGAVIGTAATLLAGGSARAEYAVASGGSLRIGSYCSVDPTCASLGQPSVGIVQALHDGRIEVRRGHDFPNFPMSNVRSRCDLRKMPVPDVLYRSAPAYQGLDDVIYEIVFPRGQVRRYRSIITVR